MCLIHSGIPQAIAAIVADRLGGPFPLGAEPEMRQRWAADSARVKRERGSVIVPVATLRVGLGVHRALLFKFLADASNVPCALVGSPCHGANLQRNRNNESTSVAMRSFKVQKAQRLAAAHGFPRGCRQRALRPHVPHVMVRI